MFRVPLDVSQHLTFENDPTLAHFASFFFYFSAQMQPATVKPGQWMLAMHALRTTGAKGKSAHK